MKESRGMKRLRKQYQSPSQTMAANQSEKRGIHKTFSSPLKRYERLRTSFKSASGYGKFRQAPRACFARTSFGG